MQNENTKELITNTQTRNRSEMCPMLASQAALEKSPQLQNKQIKHKIDPKSTDICKLVENKNTAFIFCTTGLTLTKVQKIKM